MSSKARKSLSLAVLLSAALAALSSCGPSYGGGSPTGPGRSAELNSGDFGPGGTFQHRFASAGTFPYHCVHHSEMTGSVAVIASAADSVVNVAIVSSVMSFAPASVKPGGRVIWTNNTGEIHTVTSN